MTLLGILLAAGQGSRLGMPKALMVDREGAAWSARSVEALAKGGCHSVTVVLGAAAEDAVALLSPGTPHVVADDWADGMSASLRTGLLAAAETDADAVVVSLVDLPDVGPDVVERVVATGAGADALARATYGGRPGHPVLIGRDHWAGVVEGATGDRGARDYLAAHHPRLVECGDLATGVDVDSR